MGELLTPWHLILILPTMALFGAFVIIPYWMIFKKAGFSPWLALLMVIPMVKLVVIWAIAFTDWELAPKTQA